MPPVDVDAVVLSNTRLSHEYNVLALTAPDIASAVRPGQFVMLKTSRSTDPLLRRPFSVFEVLRDEDETPIGLSLLNKKVGIGTRLLYEAEPGERLACLGPLGRPFRVVDPPMAAWMVAGGVGLAPFATLIEALEKRGTAMTLFYGGRRDSDLFYADWFARHGVSVVLSTEDGSLGHHGRVTAPLADALDRTSAAHTLMMYACGPTPMMSAVARLTALRRVPLEVSLEQVMGCGLGGCYSCVVQVRSGVEKGRYVRSCLEGPVFDAADILWEELPHV